MSATKIGNRNYFAKPMHRNNYGSYQNRHSGEYSNDSSSDEDDDKRRFSQYNRDRGYIPLRGCSDEEESNGKRRTGLRQGKHPILSPKGRGHKALDSSHESDTDEEDDDVAKRHVSAQHSSHYFEDDAKSRMKPIYSLARSSLDKPEPSSFDSDDHRSASNYDADEFEENTDDHEIDDSGDFDLPANHPQNMDTTEPNIKQQIKASKN